MTFDFLTPYVSGSLLLVRRNDEIYSVELRDYSSDEKLFFRLVSLFLDSRLLCRRYKRSIAFVATTNDALRRNVRTTFPESEITGSDSWPAVVGRDSRSV